MSPEGAFINVGACDAIARVARGAGTAKGAREVGAVIDVEAVVRSRGALVDLRTSGVGSEVAALAGARAVHEMRRLCWAREAIRRAGADACGAAAVTCATGCCTARVVSRGASGDALTAEQEGRMARTRRALGGSRAATGLTT